MTTHVFIVDSNTFKYHLEYLFAGTGAKDYTLDFNNNSNSSLNSMRENLLISMIADINRIRIGDFIIFYLQQSKIVGEGKFYGIFKVKSEGFLDNFFHLQKKLELSSKYNFQYPKNDWKFKINDNDITIKEPLSESEQIKILNKFKTEDQFIITESIDLFYKDNQYLLKSLQKSLTFRILIEPYEVYSKGVTEWEALDQIKNIQSPNQMLWSLIYRKLKANRGNTMITIYESERLFKLIRDKNNRKILKSKSYSFNINNQEIISTKDNFNYSGKKEELIVLPRLTKKILDDKAFESHLQAHICRNVDKMESLKTLLIQDNDLEWIGNEVSCGVGMQRIDIALSLQKKNDERLILPIELKAVPASRSNVIQIQRYVDWLEQYYIPNRISTIQPVLITKKFDDKKSENYSRIIKSFINFNNKNKNCLPIRYIEYNINNDDLNFSEINYMDYK